MDHRPFNRSQRGQKANMTRIFSVVVDSNSEDSSYPFGGKEYPSAEEALAAAMTLQRSQLPADADVGVEELIDNNWIPSLTVALDLLQD